MQKLEVISRALARREDRVTLVNPTACVTNIVQIYCKNNGK